MKKLKNAPAFIPKLKKESLLNEFEKVIKSNEFMNISNELIDTYPDEVRLFL